MVTSRVNDTLRTDWFEATVLAVKDEKIKVYYVVREHTEDEFFALNCEFFV